MSTGVLPAPGSGAQFTPRPHRWTCDEFHRLWNGGMLEGKSVILVDGEMLDMPAPGLPHDSSVELANRWLYQVFPADRFWVRVQMGLVLGINTDPIPDLAVVVGGPRTLVQLPHTAALVIEVADSSLAFDTHDKASLYAAAGIADYWVIDVNDRRLHVFRGPTPDASRKYGYWYSPVAVLTPTDAVAPLAAPGSPLTGPDLLP